MKNQLPYKHNTAVKNNTIGLHYRRFHWTDITFTNFNHSIRGIPDDGIIEVDIRLSVLLCLKLELCV